MKRNKFFIFSFFFLFLSLCMVSCSSDDSSPTDERPSWTVKVPDEASVNMMIYVQIPEPMKLSAADMIGAFVGNDCRALGIAIDSRTFLLTIKGVADEHSPITLRYYNADKERIFIDSDHISFLADEVIGLETPYFLIYR